MKREVNIVDLDSGQVNKYMISESYFCDVLINEDVYQIELVFKDDGSLLGIIVDMDNLELIQCIVYEMRGGDIPRSIIEYYKKYPSTRYGMITWNLAGGNAGKNSISNKISIPYKWLDLMDITKNSRDIEMKFDGTKITIEKRV